jgi:hypothetical protein
VRLDVTDRRFRQQARRWLADLDDATVTDLRAVFAASPGYYPTTLHHLWKIELRRRRLTPAAGPPVRSIGGSPVMPVAHPADYDWRFTSETARTLAARAVAELPDGAVVAHLGTPSTFLAGQEFQPSYRHVLMERNQATIDALRTGGQAGGEVIRLDLAAEQPPNLEAAAVILDPPWYPADTLAFLAGGSLACRLGARLWLCQPAPATRPGVAEERAALLAELPTLGLACEAVLSGDVRYHTPHFEAMSLRATLAGVTVPGAWRAGDLLRLRKTAAVAFRAPAAGSDRSWREARFGPVRIKLRASNGEHDLAPLVPGDVLATVSRRDPIRDRIGVWTSGNRVFGLANPGPVAGLIDRCHHDLEKARFTLARTLDHAGILGIPADTATRLFDLLLVELQEHLDQHTTTGGPAYERTGHS